MRELDVVVLGLGVHGAATALELAQRGLRVCGLDMREPPHEHGSSNGRTRIIREAYYEHPLFVPLVQRAYELWSDMEELTGTVLYRRTGGLMAGPRDGELVSGALASAREHNLEHELLDADTMRRRFPALLPVPDHAGVFEPRAGMLLVDPCIRTMLALARGYGAELRPGSRAASWGVQRGDVVVETSAGTLRARQLVIAAGAWLNPVLASEIADAPIQLPLTIERQVPHWFRPVHGSHAFHASVCPVTMLEYDRGRMIYTLPDIGHGVKAGIHHEGDIVTADRYDDTISLAEEARLRGLLEAWMPGSTETVLDARVCLYTNTPDHHFIIDRHPAHEQVMIVSACSGHGFKFAPAIAEMVADKLVTS
ncbi:MAG: N-methyl-L-tryptophan oxidase [Gemmatimonadota bacterium]